MPHSLKTHAFAQEFAEPDSQLTVVPIGLSIVACKNALPSNWYPTFQSLVGFKNPVKLKTKSSFDVIYKELINLKLTNMDLVTLGDAWLTSAIQTGCITPFKYPMDYQCIPC